jgi:POT family proton-dependent oligopeptide transporter
MAESLKQFLSFGHDLCSVRSGDHFAAARVKSSAFQPRRGCHGSIKSLFLAMILVTLEKRLWWPICNRPVADPAACKSACTRGRFMALSTGESVGTVPAEAPPARGIRGFFASHPIGFWFIFWGEFAERCSYYGMLAVLTLYMAKQLGFGEADAGTYMSFFMAACYFLPLVGGYLADNFFGKYNIIVGFSIPYILGHVILGIESPLYLAIALVLLAMGAGVIKPNISTLMGLTYDQKRPGQEQLRTSAFAMFYLSINIGAMLGAFAVPWIRTHLDSYRLAFAFPAVIMVVAFFLFALGKRFYAREVIVRTRKTPEEFMLQWQVLGRIGGLFLLVMFFWAVFNQSNITWIFFNDIYTDLSVFGYHFEPDQVQFLNPVFIVLLLPAITYLWTVLSRRGMHVRATDKMVVGFLVTALCMTVMAYAGFRAGPVEKTIALAKPGKSDDSAQARQKYQSDEAREKTADRILDLVARKYRLVDFETLQQKLNDLELLRYCQEALNRRQAQPTVIASTTGLLATPLVTAPLASWQSTLPTRTIADFVRPENKVTVWWQVLAFLLLTVAEILISVTGLELAFVAAPKSMKSFVTSMWLVTVGMASLLINAPVTRLYSRMNPGAYFAMQGVTLVVVALAFTFVAKRFNRLVEMEKAAEQGGQSSG